MKRILLSLTAIFVVMTIAARTQFPRTVQGVPYTPKAADGKLRAASDWEWATPDDMAGDANFTFDMIKNWTGEGENKAALVIQWNYDDEPAALVFGYRWTGQATGADMLKAVVKNNPRLYALMQYTNVSSPTDPNGGYTINGIGWDVDDDGDGNGDGDGRACVGVSENKVYLGSTAGIQVLDTRKLTLGGMVDGIASGENKYNGQIGDMVAIGKYAFAIQQGVGVHVIDIATDKVVKTFPVESNDASGVSGMGYPQGITVTADGNVWVATTAGASSGLCTFRCIDPSTLDVTDSVDLPEGQRVTCGWGAWRSTNFFASKSENAIWYGVGVEASIVSGNTGYYKWTVGSDIAGIQPVFVFPNNLPGVDSKTFQAPYAGVRYDDRKNQLLVAATHGASSNYRYNWLHFVDCKTGDIVKTIKLKDYYWFPSMPIFPDKYAPEFSDLPEVSVDLAKDGDIFTIDLKDYVTDKDNIDAAIRLSIVGGDAVAADNTVSDKRLVNATLENGVLTITPLIAGHGNLNVKAESNGKTTTVSIPYAVEDSASGIHNVDGAAGTLSVCDNIVTVKNMAGTTFAVYDMAGRVVGAFVADSDCARVALTLPSGVYVVASTNGSHTLKFSIQ